MPEYNIHLNALQGAYNALDPLGSTVRSCSEQSRSHSSRASSLASELEKDIEGFVKSLLGGLLDEVDGTLSSARNAKSQQDDISGLIASGFGGIIPRALSSQYLEPLAEQIGSGIGALISVLEDPANPFAWVALLEDAAHLFEDAASIINGFKERLSEVIASAKELINTANQDRIAAMANIETVIQHGLKAMDADSLPRAAQAILDTGTLDHIPLGLGIIPEAILQVISDKAHTLPAIAGSVLDFWKEKLAGLDGGVGWALDRVSTGIGYLATAARLQALHDSFLGPAYQTISHDWTQIVDPLDKLGDAVNDLSRAFVDMHGGTLIALGVAALDAGILASAIVVAGATGGMAIPFEVALVPAATAALAANAPEIGGSLVLEGIAGSNPFDVGKDFNAFGKDISQAVPGIAHGAVNIGKDEWQLMRSGHMPDIVNDAGSPVFGPMYNVEAAYIQAH